jgi:NTE family protein
VKTRSLAGYFLAAAVLLPAVVSAALAQPAGEKGAGARRPKICLVLGGGGARGAAHIGVIKMLEEYRVPIDCIAGTSMGALVGAAYASGNSASDMAKLVAGLSSEKLFQDVPPREQLQSQRKQEDRTLLFSPEIGVESIGGSMFPQGLVTGVQLESVLRDVSVPGYLNFDDLPIPFRGVATDLVAGKAVVFSKGELANVMRASMSVPVAIAPVEIEGKLLGDGMLVDNLPVDVAREMGADIVIAVNVGTPLMKRAELGSIIGIAGQMLSILTEQNVRASLALLRPSDVLISPELGEFSTGDFDHLPSTIPIGEAAARKVSRQLARFSLPPDEYAAYRKGLRPLVRRDLRAVDSIRFEKLRRVNPEYLLTLMDTRPGKMIDPDVLNTDLRRLYGTRDFEKVNYRIVEEKGQRILSIEAVEKSWGPNYLRFGMGLETDFHGEANFTAQALVRNTWRNALGGELLTDLQVGNVNRIASQFFQPLDRGHVYFVAPLFELRQATNDLFARDRRVARYLIRRYRAGLDIGRQLGEYGQARIGVRYGKIFPSLEIGPLSLSPGAGGIPERAVQASVALDRLDSVTFPREGWVAAASLYNANTSRGGDEGRYTKWDVRGTYVHSVGPHTFSLSALSNGKLNGNLPVYDQNQWGGFLRQSGYRVGQLLGESISFGRLLYYNRLVHYKVFNGLYAGFSLEVGKVRRPLVPGNSTAVLKSAAVFAATDSPIGPLYLGYGRSADQNSSFYLFLGFPY